MTLGKGVSAPKTTYVDPNKKDQILKKETGKASTTTGKTVGKVDKVSTSTINKTNTATAGKGLEASTYDADTTAGGVKSITKKLDAEEGTVSDDATVTGAQGELSEESLATGLEVDPDSVSEVTAGTRKVGLNELTKAQGQGAKAVKANIASADVPENIKAAQTKVNPNEIPEPAQIAEKDMATATAITAAGLSDDATAVAARLEKFSVDDGTLAEFKEGKIEAQDTVQGQLAELMKSFDDGTPSWAAGAMRAATAAMSSRGLGSSSMAGAAIVQAAMESAIPIASADANAFREMKMGNLNRQQQVSLTNAAAQQGVELANFNAEQQTALQNSQNAFSLQSQNLSNMQQVVLANAQIKASLQGQNLSNRQQSNLAEAARYAEVSNLNLNNRQQGILQDNANAMQVNLANMSSKQQAYLANAQLAAALQGKKIDNQQQAAMANAARFAEANNITFSAAEQAKLHNSELLKTVGLANLNAQQSAVLQNAAAMASMDMANLNNRQQAAVQNANAFLQMDMTNLSNRQQTTMFKAQQNIQALFTDSAAENASKQFNAASENQTNQFFAELQVNVSKFNADQKNATNQINAAAKNQTKQFNAASTNENRQFNATVVNATRQFNTNQKNQFKQFNITNSLVVAQANAKWRQTAALENQAAANDNAMYVAKEQNLLSNAELDEVWQRERDEMDYMFNAFENDQDRANQLIKTKLQGDSSLDAAKLQSKIEGNKEIAKGFYNWLYS